MENEYIIAAYGWALFNLIYLGSAKDELDGQHKPFNIKIWWRYAWDNVVITFVAIPAVVWFNPNLWQWIVNDWFKQDMEYSKAALLGVVPFVQFIYWIIRKISK
jgi:hypothetical protein